jgi:hypothetical protein
MSQTTWIEVAILVPLFVGAVVGLLAYRRRERGPE